MSSNYQRQTQIFDSYLARVIIIFPSLLKNQKDIHADPFEN